MNRDYSHILKRDLDPLGGWFYGSHFTLVLNATEIPFLSHYCNPFGCSGFIIEIFKARLLVSLQVQIRRLPKPVIAMVRFLFSAQFLLVLSIFL